MRRKFLREAYINGDLAEAIAVPVTETLFNLFIRDCEGKLYPVTVANEGHRKAYSITSAIEDAARIGFQQVIVRTQNKIKNAEGKKKTLSY